VLGVEWGVEDGVRVQVGLVHFGLGLGVVGDGWIGGGGPNGQAAPPVYISKAVRVYVCLFVRLLKTRDYVSDRFQMLTVATAAMLAEMRGLSGLHA